MKLTVYVSKEDSYWLKELEKYAESNKWSVSLAVRELMKAYFEKPTKIIEDLSDIRLATKEEVVEIRKEKEDKLDPATFFAEMEAKALTKGNVDVDNCDRRTIDKDGNPDCYFFNQWRMYYPFCKQCWASERIWGKRARIKKK